MCGGAGGGERCEGGEGPKGESGRWAAAAAMQEIIASVDHIKFDLEIAVEQQLGAQPLPFPGMDSERGSGAGDEGCDRLSPGLLPLGAGHPPSRCRGSFLPDPGTPLTRTREPRFLGFFIPCGRSETVCRRAGPCPVVQIIL